MSGVRLANNPEPHNPLTVSEFSSGTGGNINLAITRTTTTILSLPAAQIQPIPSLMPVNFFPNSHPFKMNHSSNGHAHTSTPEPNDKLACDLRTSNISAPLVSSSQIPGPHPSDLSRHTPLNGNLHSLGSLGGPSDLTISHSRSSAIQASSRHVPSTLSSNGPLYGANSREISADAKIRNKTRQPKYRSTKRPPSERKFKCDYCESECFSADCFHSISTSQLLILFHFPFFPCRPFLYSERRQEASRCTYWRS